MGINTSGIAANKRQLIEHSQEATIDTLRVAVRNMISGANRDDPALEQLADILGVGNDIDALVAEAKNLPEVQKALEILDQSGIGDSPATQKLLGVLAVAAKKVGGAIDVVGLATEIAHDFANGNDTGIAATVAEFGARAGKAAVAAAACTGMSGGNILVGAGCGIAVAILGDQVIDGLRANQTVHVTDEQAINLVNSLPTDPDVLAHIIENNGREHGDRSHQVSVIATLAQEAFDIAAELEKDPNNPGLLEEQTQIHRDLVYEMSGRMNKDGVDAVMQAMNEATINAMEDLGRIDSNGKRIESAPSRFDGMAVSEGILPDGAGPVKASHVAGLSTHQLDALIEGLEARLADMGIDMKAAGIDTPDEIAALMGQIDMDLSAMRDIVTDGMEYNGGEVAAAQLRSAEHIAAEREAAMERG